MVPDQSAQSLSHCVVVSLVKKTFIAFIGFIEFVGFNES